MSKKILVIDDDQGNVTLIRSHLEKADYEVVSANDGTEGLEQAKAEMPNLIILDVEMPVMNGYTFMMELQKMESFKSIPVIVLTAHAEHEPIFKMRGVKDYLIKPLNPEELLSKTKSYLEN